LMSWSIVIFCSAGGMTGFWSIGTLYHLRTNFSASYRIKNDNLK
jgi:hypothetical protein